MKKISIAIMLFIVIIISCGYNALAYSTIEYSIDIPSNYNKVSENSFTDESGKNINIQIVPFEGSGWDNPYSEKHLDEVINGLYSEIDKYREEFKNTLIEKNKKYGAGLTEEEIDNYAKSFKVDTIEKKEVTTFSKNNYKGFHVVAKIIMGEITMYMDQYMVASGKKTYTLGISCSSLDEINSTKNKNIVDSFTINNFQEIKGEGEKLKYKIITTVISTLIIGGIGSLIRKNNLDKKKDELSDKKIEEFDKTVDSKVLDKKQEIEKKETEEVNNKEEKKFCTKCGKQIENDWVFCNYCGNKLK